MDDSKDAKGIDPDRLKRFVKHMCVLAKKHKDREQAIIDLKRQMEKLKRFSSKKKEMDEGIDELNKKVSLVLEKEAELSGLRQRDNAVSRQLMNIAIENKYRMSQVNASLNEIKSRLSGYIEIKTAREKKIDELENKIKSKVKNKKEIALLKNQLKRLEKIYNQLKDKGSDAGRIESKIKGLRLKMDFLS